MIYEKVIDLIKNWGDQTLDEMATDLYNTASDLADLAQTGTVDLHEDFDPEKPVLILVTEDPIVAKDFDFETVDVGDFDEEFEDDQNVSFDLFDNYEEEDL